MHEESIIKTIRDKAHPQSKRIAFITGAQWVPQPTYYRNNENGDNYYTLAGALAYPSERLPGFAVIVAAMKEAETPSEPRFKVLDEIEAPTVEGLLKLCAQRRWRWHYPKLLGFFYGDHERYSSALTEFNTHIERSQEGDRGLYLAQPADFEQPNKTEIYLERIRSYLTTCEDGRKRLSLGSCDKLRIHLEKLPTDAAKLHIEDFPAVAALGYALHSMAQGRPWMESADSRIETYVDFQDYAESEQVRSFDDLDHSENYFDEGDTTGTI